MDLPSECLEIAHVLPHAHRVAVLHHWDTDGIASAAMLLSTAWNRIVYVGTPSIGFYGSDAIDFPSLMRASPDALVILDYGVEPHVYDYLLEKLRCRIIVVDHHLVAPWNAPRECHYCNPVARGCVEEIPSTSYLLYKILGVQEPRFRILAALGIVGDLTPYIDARLGHRGIEIAEELLRGLDVAIGELREVSEYVDSCYRLYNRTCIARVIRLLVEGDVRQVMRDPYIRRVRIRAQRVLTEALRRVVQLQENECVAVYKLVMDAYVTSYVGRTLASKHWDKYTVLIHWIPRISRGFIYVRSFREDLSGAIEGLRSTGLRVGGKRNVMVLELGSPEELNKAMKLVEKSICVNTSVFRG